MAQSEEEKKNDIAKHIRETGMRRMRFGPRWESRAYRRPQGVSNLGVRTHFLARMPGKAVLESAIRLRTQTQKTCFLPTLLQYLLAFDLGQVI